MEKDLSKINVSDVVSELENILIKKSQYTTEKNVERLICESLYTKFKQIHRQYSIGGYLPLKVDIDLGDGQVGIEIKLAKQLTTSSIERLFGQVLYYSKRTYKKNLIVLVVGIEKEKNQILDEVQTICEEQGVTFYYVIVK